MSADWVNDINRMQTKFGVRDWISKATPFELQEYLKFRLKFKLLYWRFNLLMY